MKFIKKLSLVALVACVSFNASALVLGTNIATSAAFRLLTGKGSVNSIMISSTNPVVLKFYDNNNMAAGEFGTNVCVTNTYVTKGYAVSNIVSSYVGYNGYTNWYTNAGMFTYSVTNAAATNEAPTLFSVALPANVASGVIPIDAAFSKGLVVLGNTSTNAYVIINYDP